MKLRKFLFLSLISLVVVACTRESISANKPVAITSQATPTTQVVQSENINVVSSGTFVSGEHKTEGKVNIISKKGKSFLELDKSFKTSNMGPDLVVILHRSDNVIASTNPPAYPLKKGDYVVLAPLKKFSGNQSYEIPNNINLANYKSAAIWCRKFNATFGAAKLGSS
ncbi:MAG: DM13 domain-containing protein [Scytonematopsis contorta HA4267-MV1]|jgi:hypothetical protein|nr:DM13 domain-containing protein [Scytonematopsis contorta HA4267-MV1]